MGKDGRGEEEEERGGKGDGCPHPFQIPVYATDDLSSELCHI